MTYYIGTPGGGVWKTTDAGQVWTPISDAVPVASIGAVAVVQAQPNTVYIGTGEQTQGNGEARMQAAPGEIRSTADAQAALDRICKYYEKAEPSSPVPLFLKCAQRLISKGFLDIWKELTPDLITKLETISTPPAQ